MSVFFNSDKCNSDKCHCPKCKPTITITKDVLDEMIKQRVAEAVSDIGRGRTYWRERSRQQAERVAALGMRKSYRDNYLGIGDIADYNHSRRLAELHETNRGLDGEHMTYYSRDNDACYWKWQKCEYVGWRKRNKFTGKLFGPLYRRVEFTRDGFKINTRDIIQLPSSDYSAVEHTETARVGALEKTETTRYEFGTKVPSPEAFLAECERRVLNKEVFANAKLTPLMLSILFHRAAYTSNVPYRAFSIVSLTGALAKLEGLGLVDATFPSCDYALTEAGRAYVKSVQQRGV